MANADAKKNRGARPPADIKNILPLFGSGGQAMLGYRILLVGRLIDRALGQTLKGEEGMSVNKWRVMVQLGVMGSCTVRSLADGTAIDRAEASRLIRELSQAELVDRRENPADNRSPLFSLTDAGQKRFSHLRKPIYEMIKHLVDEISDADLEAADRVLWAITQRIIDVS